MNIKSFLFWRPKCFLCGQELAMIPQMDGIHAKFSIKNNLFSIASRFVNFSIHIETGEIINTDGFYPKRQIDIAMRCLSCESKGEYYSYTGIWMFSDGQPISKMSLIETVFYNNIKITQYPISQTSSLIEAYKIWENSDGEIMKKKEINIPYIDLSETDPIKLKNKIKTYLVFS